MIMLIYTQRCLALFIFDKHMFPSPITTLVDMLPPRDVLISIQPIIVPIETADMLRFLFNVFDGVL